MKKSNINLAKSALVVAMALPALASATAKMYTVNAIDGSTDPGDQLCSLTEILTQIHLPLATNHRSNM